MLALDHLEAADTAAHINPDLFGDIRCHLEARAGKGEVRRGNRELDEAPHLLNLFFLDVVAGLEALHLARDAAGETRGVKLGDTPNAATGGENGFPGGFGANRQRRHKPYACNHYSS